MQVSTEKRRGRPPRYDRDAALAAIRDRFWAHGFSATSLDELATATAMNRPSLYAAFGDKRAMYLAALAAVGAEMEAGLKRALAAPTLKAALTRAYRAGVAVYLSGEAGPRGCMAVCTASVEATAEPEVQAALARILAGLDAALAERIAEAKAAGELGRDADPEQLGRAAAGGLHSLAIRARAGTPRAELERLAETFATLISAA
jgi:TetR/AcrR family transcriptional regulator, copper-responsive repressor